MTCVGEGKLKFRKKVQLPALTVVLRHSESESGVSLAGPLDLVVCVCARRDREVDPGLCEKGIVF